MSGAANLLVAGVVLAALRGAPGLAALELTAVPERVDGVATGRLVLVDPGGHVRCVVAVCDA